MATNEILPFATDDTGTNLLTQAEYSTDAQRDIGHQPGIARSKLTNKTMRQTSLLAAGLAEFIADYQANNVTDGLTPQQIADYLLQAITNATIPAGAIIYVPTLTVPSGYLKANGAEISRTVYDRLFSAIGTTFGAGDGSTTFRVPDLRGEFLRSWDDGRGIDPGRTFASGQRGTLLSGYDDNDVDGDTSILENRSSRNYGSDPINGSIASEYGMTRVRTTSPINFVDRALSVAHRFLAVARPRNVALLACIKY